MPTSETDPAVKPAKRDVLKQAALRLFSSRGIDAVTMRDVASAAGVAEGTFYRYYEGKDDLVGEVLVGAVSRLVRELDELQARLPHAREKIAAVVGRFYEFFDAESEVFRFLLLTQHDLHRYKDTLPQPTNVVMWIIEQGQSRGEVRAGPLKVLSAMALGAILQVPIARIYGSVKGALAPQAAEVAAGVWRLLAP